MISTRRTAEFTQNLSLFCGAPTLMNSDPPSQLQILQRILFAVEIFDWNCFFYVLLEPASSIKTADLAFEDQLALEKVC
jgi:hypothetical protein